MTHQDLHSNQGKGNRMLNYQTFLRMSSLLKCKTALTEYARVNEREVGRGK